MAKFGKWIGAGLGWTIGGPIGALLGFAFGSVLDASTEARNKIPETGTTRGDFEVSLMILFAATMQADTKVLKSELDFVKKYLVQTFGEREAMGMLKILRNILKQDIPVRDVSRQIRMRMNYSSRLQLLHLLFGIAMADGHIQSAEIHQIEQIATELGIQNADMNSIKNMFIPSTDWAYQVLETNPGVSDEEIKKAYRRLAMKNHPDKVAYLGEEIRKKANEKFQRISEAYEAIKKERGIA
ncbi:MAG: TerB family tellurite resistance protein [Bacteroidales bacterium]|nr:TerB family tellurite resistance protein [Bacteroidales bacterium]